MSTCPCRSSNLIASIVFINALLSTSCETLKSNSNKLFSNATVILQQLALVLGFARIVFESMTQFQNKISEQYLYQM